MEDAAELARQARDLQLGGVLVAALHHGQGAFGHGEDVAALHHRCAVAAQHGFNVVEAAQKVGADW